MKNWKTICLICIGLLHASAWATETSATSPDGQIKETFSEVKAALSNREFESVINFLSPDSRSFFKDAFDVARNPDADLDEVAQMAVIIGADARYILGDADLKNMTLEEFAGWCFESSKFANINGYNYYDIVDLKIDSSNAVACVEIYGRINRDQSLKFTSENDQWFFDITPVFLLEEPTFERYRENSSFNKKELAVFIIETRLEKQIPELREFKMEPEIREKIAAIKYESPDVIYDTILEELSAGRQNDAEYLLEYFTAVYPKNQKLAFANAVCIRSRFDVDEGMKQFQHVLDLDPTTPEGHCAKYVLKLDRKEFVDGNFKGLKLLIQQNPDNPLIHWAMGFMCRDFYRHTHKTTYSKDGVEAYRRLFEIFDVCPVLVHQSFANILTEELELYEEALKHRRIAVKLSPKSWSYQGLGNTLRDMGRYEEADEAYVEMIKRCDDDDVYWYSWARNCYKLKQYEKSIDKARKSLELDPTYIKSLALWGDCLCELEKYEEAIAKYNEALKLDPAHYSCYGDIAYTLRRQEKYEEAYSMCNKALEINPSYSWAKEEKLYLLILMGKHDEFIKKYKVAFEKDPKDLEIYSDIIEKLYWEKKYSVGLSLCDKMIELNPADMLAKRKKLRLLAEMNKADELLAFCKKELSKKPSNPNRFSNYWAFALNAQGKHVEAIEKAKEILAKNPKNLFAMDEWVSALVSLKQYEAAISKSEEVFAINPKWYPTLKRYAYALEKSGKLEEAIKGYQNAIDLWPNDYYSELNPKIESLKMKLAKKSE